MQEMASFFSLAREIRDAVRLHCLNVFDLKLTAITDLRRAVRRPVRQA